ncbi:MAG TPA: alpha/beta hydrolase [Crenotrichaceae bacterium]|nr:alpha/beta hydrolase [Crenotrichaceae bacterium]
MKKLVLYHHGKDSIPWGEKTFAIAEVSKQQGYDFDSVDYTDSNDPDLRVKKLVENNLSRYDKLVFVGSSMGGYVSTVAAEIFKPQALFLIAPAFYLPGYPQTAFTPPENTWVMHGWQDTVVPPENSWKFCQQYRATLKMFDSDHRLISVLPSLKHEFEQLLLHLNETST